jgi:diaminohydroxyphosphoribosylaminopyrimidine deaminase / 5-amino-6-(5-phosphoribosylamino)uracil reductase
MASRAEDEAMRHAIALAAFGLGTTSPNPVMGCVILDAQERVVGEGFHAYAGGPHAEIVALAHAGERAKHGTAVVTLESCDSVGRTGPCTRALIQAGIRRVVIAVTDPNPLAGHGAATLRAAGVEVEMGVREEEAATGNVAWLTAVRRGWPYVTWRVASTLDGRTAAVGNSSEWITSEAARIDVHQLRGEADAIIIGVGTVLADNPRLTVRNVRDGSLAIRQSLRVVVDGDGETPPDARVRDGLAETWIATAAEVGTGPDGLVDLRSLLRGLYQRGVRAALLEGGPTLAAGFLSAGLVDRVIGYMAPKLLGAGRPSLSGKELSNGVGVGILREPIDLEFTEITLVGPDIRFTAVPLFRSTETQASLTAHLERVAPPRTGKADVSAEERASSDIMRGVPIRTGAIDEKGEG